MQERSYRFLLWSLALIGLVFDLGSKYGVFAWLYDLPNNEFALIRTQSEGDFRGFRLVAAYVTNEKGQVVPHVNHGALFGFLREQKSVANLTFAGISLVAAVAIMVWSFSRSIARDVWLCVALGLILGGTLGNFYDRVVFNGVRDFLHWHIWFDWPVFNIADCCLVCGAAVLLIQAFLVQSSTTLDQEANPNKEAEIASAS